jgi:predicted  nucleic acid-binding Zn-ribbon protein
LLERRHTAIEKRTDLLERQTDDIYDQLKDLREQVLGQHPQLERLNWQVPDIYLRLGELRDDLGPVELRAMAHSDRRAGEVSARIDLLTEKVHDVRDALRDNLDRLRKLDELGLDLDEMHVEVKALQVVLDRRLEADLEATEATGRFLRSQAARLESLAQLVAGDGSPEAGGEVKGAGAAFSDDDDRR